MQKRRYVLQTKIDIPALDDSEARRIATLMYDKIKLIAMDGKVEGKLQRIYRHKGPEGYKL